MQATVTDSSGLYRIVDLRPGTYTVTFKLSGFNTVRREGIMLEGTFTATVNADLRVGAVEETITVSGDEQLMGHLADGERLALLTARVQACHPEGR